MELDYYNSTSNGNSDERIGILKALVKKNCDITIHTSIHKRDEPLLNGDFSGREYLSFLEKVKYDPISLPEESDLLFVEQGTDNMTYPYSHIKGKLFMRRAFECIDKFKGPVAWFHSDPTLPFTFRQMIDPKYEWGHPNNGYTNKEKREPGWTTNSGWATREEIISGKKHYVLIRTDDIEGTLNIYNGARPGYKDLRDHLEFRYMPVAYDYDLGKRFKVKKNLNNFLIYTGGDRSRRPSFRKYYDNIAYDVLATGRWKDDVISTLHDNITFTGWIKYREEVQDLINDSKVCVQIGPQKAIKLGWTTARLFEIASCRCISLLDSEVYKPERFVPSEWYIVNGREDALDRYKEIQSMSYKKRKKAIYKELNFMKENWNWDNATKPILDIVNENSK